ncbi:MAG: segregation/condensation protein A [Patescibacteria group bacterium]|jgi:segregation and condensation protein A
MMDVTCEKFSGPFGLLLSLIESEEMDITEIALAKIADEYVAYVRANRGIDPEELADFLVIAAKLLFIKSKALLPYLYTGEEEEEINDLERQLRMYKEFVAASQKVKELVLSPRRSFLPPLTKNRRGGFNLPVFCPPAKLNAALLHERFLILLANLEKQLAKMQEEKLPEKTLEPKISIDDKIASIKQMISNKIKVNFSRLLASAATRTEVIVSFLAVLELAKQKELFFEQDELFSEILISRPADAAALNNQI